MHACENNNSILETQFKGKLFVIFSEADPKGSDCYEKFSVMQGCMADYPELYGKDEDDDELSAALEQASGEGGEQAAGEGGERGERVAGKGGEGGERA